MKYIYIIYFLSLSNFCLSQDLILSPNSIKKNGITEIIFNDFYPFEPGLQLTDDGVINTTLYFDTNGFLLKSHMVCLKANDTVHNSITKLIYKNDSLFLKITKSLICEEYRNIDVFGPDSTCLTNINFNIYEFDSLSNISSYKTYISDDDLNLYLNQLFFTDSQLKKDFPMFRREMEWLNKQQNIHHFNYKNYYNLLNEIFIIYSYTAEPYEIIDDNGDTLIEYSKGLYSFLPEDFIDNETNLETENFNEELKHYQIEFISSNKKFKSNLKKSKSVTLQLPYVDVKVNFVD